MLVSPWQLISIPVLAVSSLANPNFYKRIGVPTTQMYSLDDGADYAIRGPPAVGRIDSFDHDHDQINGMMAEASAIKGDACSTGQTKQLSGTKVPREGWNIASRNAPQESDGHKNGEACRNVGAMSDVPLIPIADLEQIIEADRIGPERNPTICKDADTPIPVCAPDQLFSAGELPGRLSRCRPCKFTSANFR